jgi:hypothetical protein
MQMATSVKTGNLRRAVCFTTPNIDSLRIIELGVREAEITCDEEQSPLQ